MTSMWITVLAYFLTDALNWQVFWGKEKYLLNSLDENWKIRFLYNKQIKGQILIRTRKFLRTL